MVLKFYKSLVRPLLPLLEYCVQALRPYSRKVTELLEGSKEEQPN
jgi:hypothetical protein